MHDSRRSFFLVLPFKQCWVRVSLCVCWLCVCVCVDWVWSTTIFEFTTIPISIRLDTTIHPFPGTLADYYSDVYYIIYTVIKQHFNWYIQKGKERKKTIGIYKKTRTPILASFERKRKASGFRIVFLKKKRCQAERVFGVCVCDYFWNCHRLFYNPKWNFFSFSKKFLRHLKTNLPTWILFNIFFFSCPVRWLLYNLKINFVLLIRHFWKNK